MARIKNGINTPLSGKIGNLVACQWKGIPYLRSRPSRVNHPDSVKQLAHRMKFSIVMKFLSPFKDFLKFSFAPYANEKTGFNVAVSENMKTAIQGEYPELSINYSEVVLSKGDLSKPSDAMIEAEGEDAVRISWTNSEEAKSDNDTDRAIVLFYNPDNRELIYYIGVAKRSDSMAIISLPYDFQSCQLECYLIFIAQEAMLSKLSENTISDSFYLGQIGLK